MTSPTVSLIDISLDCADNSLNRADNATFKEKERGKNKQKLELNVLNKAGLVA